MATESSGSRSSKVIKALACFAIPLAVMTYFVWSANHDNAYISIQEMAGDAYQAPLEKILRDVMDHQILLHRCPSGRDCSSNLAALSDAVNKDIAELHSVDKQYGKLLEFTATGLAKRGRQLDTADALEKGWRDIAATADQSKGKIPEGIDAKYDDVINIDKVMIQHMGDTSQLILDPTLDSYHFMSDTLLTLPQTQERIANMIKSVREAYMHGVPFSEKDRIILAQHAANLQSSDIDQLNLDTNTALKENSNDYHKAVDSFQTKIPQAQQSYVDAAEALVNMTNKMAIEPRPPYSMDEYTAAAAKARQAAFDMWFTGIPELDNLIRVRGQWFDDQTAQAVKLATGGTIVSCVAAALVL